MGGVGSVVLPDGGGLDGDTHQPLLLDPGDKVDVHVLGKHIGGAQNVQRAHAQLAQHPHQGPAILRGDTLVHLIEFPHPGQQDVRPLLSRFGPLHLLQESLIPGLAGLGEGVGIGERLSHGDGQHLVGPRHPLLPADLQQGEQVGVALGLLPHDGGVQRDLIDRPVGHQHPAVPVQNLAPGGLHGLGFRNVAHGSLPIVGAVDNLKIVEHGGKDADDEHQDQGDDPETGAELSGFQGVPPYRRPGACVRRGLEQGCELGPAPDPVEDSVD